MSASWYILRVPVNREDSTGEKLTLRVKADGLEHRIPRVVVPAERVTEIKSGKKKVVRRKIYPGYILVNADLGDWGGEVLPVQEEDQNVWFALKSVRGIRFMGVDMPPAPMEPGEVEPILERMEETEDSPRMAIRIKRGDMVQIKEGPFEGFDGSVEEVLDDKGLLRIAVTIFGRATTVEIEHWLVDPI
ncbi:MAG: transcription termination/antitermination factor NusG [Planctomycetes bacterium]|jgi:transcriptional antiterminator NusG|nr:transcription termination/antitermination factor NusG [Planctomycetota bacterium]MBT4028247.1 transcription termination/antitermination factor NusG [Planctomycetota bacterium]MBT4560960.1 transcription termination/antitermination factor NusG [Planctomycetota bacterium]MBT7012063.1 transcription termination/antitermination factor NusG [Planctomycetota bacterium]MBT7319300.1 transcription termination/antitermination factor NusG [Planctomycetota bacterium]